MVGRKEYIMPGISGIQILLKRLTPNVNILDIFLFTMPIKLCRKETLNQTFLITAILYVFMKNPSIIAIIFSEGEKSDA